MRTVLIVDDDKDLRYMLRYLIESTTSFEVVGEAGDGQEAIDLTRKLHPDLIIMDAAMPTMDGVEATKRIKEMWPRTYILGLTAFSDYPEVMLGSGANKCLLKTEAYGSLTTVMERLKDESETGSTWY
ncbi:MAG: response regulator transcription factor [Actinomycetota bacterium]